MLVGHLQGAAAVSSRMPDNASSSLLPCSSAAGSLLGQDPLLNYIRAQLAVPPRADTTTTPAPLSKVPSDARKAAAKSAAMQPWEVSFSELEILEVVGEGSFGRVSGAGACMPRQWRSWRPAGCRMAGRLIGNA